MVNLCKSKYKESYRRQKVVIRHRKNVNKLVSGKFIIVWELKMVFF